MKKIVVIFIILTIISGCGNNEKGKAVDLNAYLTGSQDQQAERLMKTIIMALDEKDAGLLKSVFSEDAKASCPELDRQIEELFAYYERPTKIYDGYSPYAEGQTSLSSDSDGKVISDQGYWLITGEYQVETITEKYWVNFAFYSGHESDPRKNGIFNLEIITDSLMESEGTYRHSIQNEKGIFVDQ